VGGDPIEALRRIVVGDGALTSRLAALTDPDAFVAGVLSVARAHGIGLTADDLVDKLQREAVAQYDRWE
jgi:hypothetical protein